MVTKIEANDDEDEMSLPSVIEIQNPNAMKEEGM